MQKERPITEEDLRTTRNNLCCLASGKTGRYMSLSKLAMHGCVPAFGCRTVSRARKRVWLILHEFHELKMKEFVVEVVRSVAGEGMMQHWRNEGIYRAPSRAAHRRDEQRGMRRDDGWKRDPCHEREVKLQPSDRSRERPRQPQGCTQDID
jgi:hypothetical protein